MEINETNEALRKLLETGNLHANKGNVGMAIHQYEEALKINWLAGPVWFNMSLVLTAVGDYFNATNAITRAIRLEPEQYDYWLKKGQLHYLQWDLMNALLCFEQCIRRNPSDSRSYFFASSLLLRHGNKEQALSFCEEGLSLCSPESKRAEELLFVRAKILQMPEFIEEQESLKEKELDFLAQFYLIEDKSVCNKYLSELIHIDPEFLTIPVYQKVLEGSKEPLISLFLDQTVELEKQEKWDGCIFLYEKALEVAMADQDRDSQKLCLELLFHAFQKLEKSSIAFHLGQMILTYIQKDDIEVLATALNQIGMLSDHLLCFPQAQELFEITENLSQQIGDPIGVADARFNLGYSYYYEKRFSAALEILNTFLEDPRLGREAQERIFLIQEKISEEELKGDEFVEEGKFREALKEYEKADSPLVSQKMAKIYGQLEEWDLEKKYLSKTTTISQENYWVFDRLAELDSDFQVYPQMKSKLMPR